MEQPSHQQGRSNHDAQALILPEVQAALLNTFCQVHQGKKHEEEEEEDDAEEEEEDEDHLVALIVATIRQCIEYNDEEEEEEDAQEGQIYNERITINRKRSRTPAKQVMLTDDDMCQRPYTP